MAFDSQTPMPTSAAKISSSTMLVIVRSRSSSRRASARSSLLLLIVVHVSRSTIQGPGDQTFAMVSFTFATSCLSVNGFARKL